MKRLMSQGAPGFAPWLLVLVLLGACVSDPARTLPPLPVEAGPARAVVRLADGDRQTFARAELTYPADAGERHRIPVGDFLVSLLVQVFPAEVDLRSLRLGLWQASCGKVSTFDSRVVCSVIGEVAVQIAGKRLDVPFRVANRILGPRVAGSRINAWQGDSPEEQALHDGVRALTGQAVLSFRDRLRAILAGEGAGAGS